MQRNASSATPARQWRWARPSLPPGPPPRLISLFFLPLVLLPTAVRAGGTLAMADLLPLLKQKPQLSGFLFHSYALPSSAYAQIRLGSHFQHLGGKRLGPYLLEAQTVQGRERGRALISLCTQHLFLDSAGEVIPTDADQHLQATAVREELTAVVVRDVSAIESGDGCPPSPSGTSP